MKIIPRRRLTQSQIDSISSYGLELGKKLLPFGLIKKINQQLENKRKTIFPMIFIFVLIITIIGLKYDYKHLSPSIHPIIPPLQPQDKITLEYQKILSEQEIIIDSIQYLIDRGHMSHEDSVYIAWGIKYLKLSNFQSHEKI